jgi:hypothetical protein
MKYHVKPITSEQKAEAIFHIRAAMNLLRTEDVGVGIGEAVGADLAKIDRRLRKAIIINGVLIDKGGTLTLA